MHYSSLVKKNTTRCIYLAHTGTDLELERLKIKRELHQHGFKVIPERYPPSDINKSRQQILNDLSKCELSVHLISEEYGDMISRDKELSLFRIAKQIRC